MLTFSGTTEKVVETQVSISTFRDPVKGAVLTVEIDGDLIGIRLSDTTCRQLGRALNGMSEER